MDAKREIKSRIKRLALSEIKNRDDQESIEFPKRTSIRPVRHYLLDVDKSFFIENTPFHRIYKFNDINHLFEIQPSDNRRNFLPKKLFITEPSYTSLNSDYVMTVRDHSILDSNSFEIDLKFTNIKNWYFGSATISGTPNIFLMKLDFDHKTLSTYQWNHINSNEISYCSLTQSLDYFIRDNNLKI